MCSAMLLFAVVTGPIMGTFCATWVILASSDSVDLAMSPLNGELISTYNNEKVIFFTVGSRVGYDVIAEDEDNPDWGCLAPSLQFALCV